MYRGSLTRLNWLNHDIGYSEARTEKFVNLGASGLFGSPKKAASCGATDTRENIENCKVRAVFFPQTAWPH